jgi:tetratricopeptide (TPR) repeat protein
MRKTVASCFVVYLLLCVAGFKHSTASQVPKTAHQFVEEVSRRLLAVAKQPSGFTWPPAFQVQASAKINAYATAHESNAGRTAQVVVYEGLLSRVVEGDSDRLAFVLGHELSHILLGHVLTQSATRTPFLQATFTREQEIAADQRGMELALSAGYSYRRALKGIQRAIEIGLDYSSFEGLSEDHPSWTDRIALLDKEQSSLWKAMSAFYNGNVFLTVEQYGAAERCFRAVTKEFPSCHEAWANLGYALLMQYTDALDIEDLRRFDLGQIVCGGFYRRPQSLEGQVRGVDEELWWSAVGALREALRLKPDSTLVKANLGVAYLVRPAGKDVGQASKYLQEAADAAATDTALDEMSRATLSVNAGVAELAGGRSETSLRRFTEGEEYAKRFSGSGRKITASLGLGSALLYNRALLLSISTDPTERRAAVGKIETYLQQASAASAWWALAYDRYVVMCREQMTPPKAKGALRSGTTHSFRPLTSVEIGKNIAVTLSDPIVEVKKRLGPGEETPVVAGTNLKRLRYADKGVELLAGEQVLAICLNLETSPTVKIRESGLGTKVTLLSVGMTREIFEQILGDEDYDFRQLTDPNLNYRFYRAMGLAIRIDRGRIAEIQIVQIPERSLLGGSN